MAGADDQVRAQQSLHPPHIGAHLCRRAVGQELLHVDAAQERDPALELRASCSASMSRARACNGCRQSTPASIRRSIT